MSTALQTLTSKLAARLGMEGNRELEHILKATAFKQRDGKPPSDAQMTALMIVANQYGLNPWTKEIYAYPDKQNGIVPVVGVDGWSRIINDHPQMDGVKFTYSTETVEHKGKTCHEWIECSIYRKDRSNPIVIREFFAEVVRSGNFTTPWDSHPNRMHRHKSLIQGARIAFGFTGIYDQDEAERILERDMGEANVVTERQPESPPLYAADKFDANYPAWQKAIESGKLTVTALIAKVGSVGTLTDDQKQQIEALRDAAPIEGEMQ
jgi:phage recombination protein Bet